MAHESGRNTIAKNTIYLYFRMMFTMVVALYTSRVILKILGAEDYGIYQTVGGVVGMLSFLNGALSTGTSRFLTFELGAGDVNKLKRTFSTVLFAHLILAFIILIIAETVGLWFVCNKLIIPENRMTAAVMAYHFSIVAAIVSITQVPYTACIIAREKMGIYAYMSIIEAVLKLSIVYLLSIGDWDKLGFYAFLYLIVNVIIASVYRLYCVRHFDESKFRLLFDKSILKNVLSYSGWNLLANTSLALVNQGGLVLINLFFTPIVVTAQTLASQVNMAATQFIQNFRTAANPQIVKRYATKDYDGSKHLLLSSTKYSYFLMLMLVLPIVLVSDILLELWLGEVPEYTSGFLKITAIGSLFSVFDTSFYTALYAKGRIRENALISPFIYALVFPITYFCFKAGMSPLSLSIGMVCASAIVGLIVKPYLIVKIVDYKWEEIIFVLRTCLIVTLTSLIIPLLVYINRNLLFPNNIIGFLIITIVSIISVLVSAFVFGVDRVNKKRIIDFVIKKTNNENRHTDSTI